MSTFPGGLTVSALLSTESGPVGALIAGLPERYPALCFLDRPVFGGSLRWKGRSWGDILLQGVPVSRGVQEYASDRPDPFRLALDRIRAGRYALDSPSGTVSYPLLLGPASLRWIAALKRATWIVRRTGVRLRSVWPVPPCAPPNPGRSVRWVIC